MSVALDTIDRMLEETSFAARGIDPVKLDQSGGGSGIGLRLEIISEVKRRVLEAEMKEIERLHTECDEVNPL